MTLKLGKNVRKALYLGAWVSGLCFIAAGFFTLIHPEDRPMFFALLATASIAMLIWKSNEERKRVQREEDIRRIKDAIRDALREHRDSQRK